MRKKNADIGTASPRKQRSQRHPVAKRRRPTRKSSIPPSPPSPALGESLTARHREHHRGEFPDDCAHCRRESKG